MPPGAGAPVTRVRKWLGYSFDFQLTLGELLVIALLVILVNVIWPGVPVWVFVPIGVAVGVGRDVGRWLHRRRSA